MIYFSLFLFISSYLVSWGLINHFFKAKIHNKPENFQVQKDSFTGTKEYINYLAEISKLPRGFKTGLTRFTFCPLEVADKVLPMNVTLITLDSPTSSFAAMFTSNKVPGGPVIVGKNRMKTSKYLQAIIINNKISNVSPSGVGDRGAGDSERLCEGVAKALGLSTKDYVFPSSTGIIGWRLPVESIEKHLLDAIKTLQSDSILPAALGITTTDRYAKLRRYDSEQKTWSIVGIAKGAGMIEPNMATMLCYITTDLEIPRSQLQDILHEVAQQSFNTISVDGDQSTSDTVLVISSNIVKTQANDIEQFKHGLQTVCSQLSEDIVRNGEGTQHVIKVEVTGAPTSIFAKDLGRFITNSNLVKCAIAGCDPNVGRIMGAIGSFLSKPHPDINPNFDYIDGIEVLMGDVVIFKNGSFQLDSVKEKILSDYMFDCQLYPSELPETSRTFPTHSKCVDIIVKLSGKYGNSSARVIGSDLTKEYVEINADYRS